MSLPSPILYLLCLAAATSVAAQDLAELSSLDRAEPQNRSATPPRPVIPPELMDDEHVREEFGINEFTTPSIAKLFSDLDDLGTIPYRELPPYLPESLPPERLRLALNLGTLIADGFLAVQAEKIEDIEAVGRSILDTAKALGAGKRIARHGKALLENSLLGQWDSLKEELAATQKDVELEMLLLRDHEMAHLVSLGGWIRALDIATTTALHTEELPSRRVIDKPEVVLYFASGLETLHPRLLNKAPIGELRQQIAVLAEILQTLYESEELLDPDLGFKGQKETLIKLNKQARDMLRTIREPSPQQSA